MSFWRSGLRFFQADTQVFRQMFQQSAKRRITTPAETNVEPPHHQSRWSQIWNSEVGPKTVHFWAPVFKWGLVLATASDFTRPASQLSISQNAALMATGTIWTRWCFVIRPKNYGLAAVNFLLAWAGATQVTRAVRYQQSEKAGSVADEAQKTARDEAETAKAVVEHPQDAAKKAGAVAS